MKEWRIVFNVFSTFFSSSLGSFFASNIIYWKRSLRKEDGEQGIQWTILQPRFFSILNAYVENKKCVKTDSRQHTMEDREETGWVTNYFSRFLLRFTEDSSLLFRISKFVFFRKIDIEAIKSEWRGFSESA